MCSYGDGRSVRTRWLLASNQGSNQQPFRGPDLESSQHTAKLRSRGGDGSAYGLTMAGGEATWVMAPGMTRLPEHLCGNRL
jgi:hypothetical protein